ncbi:MocR-like pyridoxine biosynthesis transcription factor PdxR [Luteipulveratus flavus]|uniref:PLP-dependent aminotransferase family protein n=1 Tax=Luteipulveratus flavus TaxID=3031728 RepID=A0ABT6C592_9MICO|nr:PLP-dependent aminotransferase family protein [Luteipulveratus sp. YIM 133296]MDF8263985.1 PLP-dependent aminotransferase family protein [Luteipulveratus sp. YIM 133296]
MSDDLGSDFLQLASSDLPVRGRAEHLTALMRAAVADGRLRTGVALPSSRRLAAELGLSRGVVVEVYRRLADEGLVEGRTGVGTVITARPGRRGPAAPRETATPADGGASPVLPPTGDASVLDLSPGVPDLAAFPREAWLRAERTVLAEAGPLDLGYGDPRGHERLRVELASYLGRMRGVRIGPEDVMVVAGVAQALALLSQVLRAGGLRSVAVEDPGSRGVRDEVAHWGLRPVGVPVDADGLDVGALAAAEESVVVTTPAHQFPTGVVLSPARRRELLAWADERQGLVVEDDYDAEHRYDRPPVPALHASAPDRVAHTGSTSKSLAPGLRLGWLLAPTRLRPALLAARHASDIAAPALPQLVLADLLASGAYERHLRAVRVRQRRRRDAVVETVRDRRPDLTVEGVAAGLHLLVRLPAHLDDIAVAEAAREAGLRVQPLSWHRQADGPPGLIIGYAAHPPDGLREAITRLLANIPRRP